MNLGMTTSTTVLVLSLKYLIANLYERALVTGHGPIPPGCKWPPRATARGGCAAGPAGTYLAPAFLLFCSETLDACPCYKARYNVMNPYCRWVSCRARNAFQSCHAWRFWYSWGRYSAAAADSRKIFLCISAVSFAAIDKGAYQVRVELRAYLLSDRMR